MVEFWIKKITCAFVSLAVGGLGKVEEGEEEKGLPSHPWGSEMNNVYEEWDV